MSELSYPMPRCSFLWLTFAVSLASGIAPSFIFGAGCEPEAITSLRSLEETFGPPPVQKADPNKEAQQLAELKRIAAQHEKLRREKLEQDAVGVTNRLQTSLNNPNLWLARARIRQELGHREAAISDLTEVLNLQSESVEALTLRGQLWTELNEFDKAENDLSQAIKLDRDNAEGYFGRGTMYMEQWNTLRAINDFSRAIQLDPDHKMAHYNRAYLVLGLDLPESIREQAANDLKRVLELDPDMLPAHFHYARVLQDTGQHEEAVREASYVIGYDPDSECMYLLRYHAYMSLQQYENALKDITRYIEFAPQDLYRVGMRGEVYFAMGKYEQSIEDWNNYVKARPNRTVSYRYRALSNEHLNRYQEALSDWDTLITMQPQDSQWYHMRAITKSKMGRLAEALSDLNTAVKLDRDNAELYGSRAAIHRQMGETVLAKSDSDRMLQLQKERTRREEMQRQQEQQRQARKAQKAQEIARKKQQDTQVLQQQLEQHVAQLLPQLRAKQPLSVQALHSHSKAEAYAPIWITALTSLLNDADEKVQQHGINCFQSFCERMGNQPLTQEDTQEAVAALEKLASGDHPQDIQNKAKKLIKGLAILVEINDPNRAEPAADSQKFRWFYYAADRMGREGHFRMFSNQYNVWIEFKGNKLFDTYREVTRTAEYVEVYSFNRGMWIRLTPTEAMWSVNHQAWTTFAQGESSYNEKPKTTEKDPV
ncbi:tetratricopeptide repeat protein [Blastopirellula marina]|uniref:Uncharacterized protein n=1 Tax=Blastopirellula marina TaxID=124 RepID=A0A2S8GDY4_9BACT|nr:tetratricopeptide repeat protein [Blastopirellula marina]PQO42649.1 hypothetical protein C5Y98_02080 [Blastopirellula marina]PTL46415.1 tetratricopeptide repeat protein [Blastopirellula marina]